MVTSTVLSPGDSTTSITPDRPVNRPRTLVSMKCRPMKASSVWPGSICHRPGVGSSAPPTIRVAVGPHSVWVMRSS